MTFEEVSLVSVINEFPFYFEKNQIMSKENINLMFALSLFVTILTVAIIAYFTQ